MKAEELRIGIVLNILPFERVGFNPVVIDAPRLTALLTGEETIYFPIPLTPQILEAAGFEKWENGGYSRRIDEYICLIIYPNGLYGLYSWSVENENQFILISQDNRVEYLHQVQNLFFGLTQIELTINLNQLQQA